MNARSLLLWLLATTFFWCSLVVGFSFPMTHILLEVSEGVTVGGMPVRPEGYWANWPSAAAVLAVDFLPFFLPAALILGGLLSIYGTGRKAESGAVALGAGELVPMASPGSVEEWLDLVFGSSQERAEAWLSTPLPDLDGRTPREVLQDGAAGEARIVEFLASFQAGAFL